MFFERLAYASKVEISNEDPQIADAVACVTDAARLFIPLSEIIDKDKELARLTKEKTSVEKDITIISGKLNNPGFLAKAPAQLVESEKAKLAKAKEKLAKIEQSIAML